MFGAVPSARWFSSFAVSGEQMFVFGGSLDEDESSNACCLHSFDFLRRVWTELPLCEQLAGLSEVCDVLCIPAPGDTLYFFGGIAAGEVLNLSLAYDVPAGAWRAVSFSGDLPEGDWDGDSPTHLVAVVGNKAFVVTPDAGAGHVHVLDFASLRFSKVETAAGLKPDFSKVSSLAADPSKKLVHALVVDVGAQQGQLWTLHTETLTWATATPPFVPKVGKEGFSLHHVIVLPRADDRYLLQALCHVQSQLRCCLARTRPAGQHGADFRTCLHARVEHLHIFWQHQWSESCRAGGRGCAGVARPRCWQRAATSAGCR